MAFVKAVTGRGITTSIALELTDLGIMRWDADRNCVAVMFGDSFSFSWGQDWRSPVVACYDADFNVLGVPVVGGIARQPAKQLWEYGHNNPHYSTVLPCDFIRIGRVWHVAVMLTQGLGNEKMTEFWHSLDLVNWTLSRKGFAHPGSDPCTTMLSFDQFGDHIYVAGTHGLRRDGPVKMWKVRADSFPHGVWHPCHDGKVMREGRHGELCLRNVQGNAVLSFFDEQGYKQTALAVASPEDDWSAANRVDYADGRQTPQLYGGYIAPNSRLDESGGMKFFVSQWGTAKNDPYHVLLFSGTLQAKRPKDADEPSYAAPVARSENGWQPGWVDVGQLEWIKVPGVDVRLQLRKGQPAKIMGAFAADYHAYIEHLRDPDSGGYRPTDSVATSNHLNGTAMDLNHTTHTFRAKDTFTAVQQATIRELLEWYEGTIFWGGNWSDPIDEMHWQMGGSTFSNPHTEEFIAQKIRPDGFSRFRRGSRIETGVIVGEKVLAFDKSIIPQQTGYWCGPASAQIILAIQGLNIPEDVLARECGTHTGGTDHIRLIERCLDARLPGANYTSVNMPNDPPTRQQKDLLWAHLTKSIDAGYGLVMNWVAPPGNYPRGVKGSPNLQYGGGTIYHYVACVGYDDSGTRSVFIADPGFRPFQAWIGFDQCATLLPPKGYSYANATPVVPTPPVVVVKPTSPAVVVPPIPAVPSRALAGRPRDHNALPVSVEDALLDMRAENLVTQALVFALCQKMGVDADAVYQRVKGSFND